MGENVTKPPKIIIKPAFRVIKLTKEQMAAMDAQIVQPPTNFYHTQKFHDQVRYHGDRLSWKKDLLNFTAIIVIFTVMSFLMLTLLLRGFSFVPQVFSIRIWHYMLAVFGGGALGVAGFLLQKMTKNNLADVSVLGIGSLNIIFVTLYILSTYKSTTNFRDFLPLVTISSSILGTGIIYFLAKLGGKNTDRFIIIGIALQFLFEAISIAMVNPKNSSAPGDTMQVVRNEITNFSLGKFPNVNNLARDEHWRMTTLASAVGISLIIAVVWLLRKKIDLIETNEKLAIAYGIKVERLKLLLYFFIALLAGIEAALIGTIALLGILAPNIARMIFGNKSSTNILASFFIGALLVMFAAFVSVNLETDIPIGFLSTAIIAPYFLYMILKRQKK